MVIGHDRIRNLMYVSPQTNNQEKTWFDFRQGREHTSIPYFINY